MDSATKDSRRKVVRLPDHVTMVLDSGSDDDLDGVPMLLLHSLGLDHRFWRAVSPALAGLGRVIAYDLRGHGRAQDAPLTVSMEQLAEDAVNLLDRLRVKQVDVFGAS